MKDCHKLGPLFPSLPLKCVSSTLFVVAGLCFSSSLLANNAFNPHGYGTKSKAMGGAGMALPEETASVINNPAVALAVAGTMQAGIAVLHPRARYSTSESENNGENGTFTIGPNAIEAKKKYRVQPYFATSAQLQENSAVSVALYTRSGLNINYRGGSATFDPDGDGPEPVQTLPGTFGDGDAKWRVTQTLVDMAYARQVSEKISLGFAGVLAAQSFKIDGVGSFAPLTETYAESGGSLMPDSLSGNKNDWAFGAGVKVGIHAQLNNYFSAGLMYQTKIWMGRHRDYSDLIPGHGSLDIPANLKAGITWKPLDNLAFSIDAERIFNAGVDAYSNPIENTFDCPTANQGGTDTTSCLGGKNGTGLGWNSMNVYKIGGQWGVTESWTLRAGFSFGDQPISVKQVTNNILTPYLAEAHYTLGFSYRMASGSEWNFSAAYSEEESQYYPNTFDPSQEVMIEADQFDFELSYSWRF